jgi:outer membrane receptor for ferrienterochelin and colicins
MSLIFRGFIIILLSGIPFSIQAQESVLSGRVLDENNEAVIGASVFLQGTFYGTATEIDGSFQLKKAPTGKYTLVISAVGYKSLKRDITLPSKEKLTFRLEEKTFFGDAAVVTATRSRRDQESIPTPVSVVPEEEIQLNGTTRLNDILDEQTGLNVVNNFGSGVQLQGLDPDYTLILVDGEPLIGRSAGTLDLSRINIGNVKQIEIVKGPSSAIWGSDALAGVINIITEEATKPFTADADLRYGNFNAYQTSARVGLRQGRFSSSTFVNLEGTEGNNLQDSPGTESSVPSLVSTAIRTKNEYQLSNRVNLFGNFRYYYEDIQNDFPFAVSASDTVQVGSNNILSDLSINPGVEVEFDIPLTVVADYYLSRYNTKTRYSNFDTADPDLFQSNDFEQFFQKIEFKNLYAWSGNNLTTLGFGQNIESLNADIYADGADFTNSFLFLQHELYTGSRLNLTGGFRFDNHSEYDQRLTPKFSALFKLNDKIHTRASVGTGFRAPDFRQLFLDFDNPVAGYSVFGARNAVAGLNRLEDRGQLNQIIIPESRLQNIDAETSLAINAGFDLYPDRFTTIRVNAFRNNVQNLIEFQPIAILNSNQFVFSYFNLDEIRSQGVEVETRLQPSAYFENRFDVNLTLGFQYLDASREIEIERNVIEGGQLVTVTETKRLQLQNRSAESGNIKLFVNDPVIDTQFSIRANYRGSFNIGDINGNNRFDDFETADPFWIWDASISKTFNSRYSLQVGVDNIFDYTDPRFLPGLLGSRYYARLSINIK